MPIVEVIVALLDLMLGSEGLIDARFSSWGVLWDVASGLGRLGVAVIVVVELLFELGF